MTTGKIDISQLPIPVLTTQKQQLDQEINFIKDSLNTLRVVQSKFQDSKKSVEKVKGIREENKSEVILAPLSESLFVDAKMTNDEKLLINVGTGYYFGLTAEKSIDYFQRRCIYVAEQIDIIQKIFNEKSLTREVMEALIKERVQMMNGKRKEDVEGEEQSGIPDTMPS